MRHTHSSSEATYPHSTHQPSVHCCLTSSNSLSSMLRPSRARSSDAWRLACGMQHDSMQGGHTANMSAGACASMSKIVVCAAAMRQIMDCIRPGAARAAIQRACSGWRVGWVCRPHDCCCLPGTAGHKAARVTRAARMQKCDGCGCGLAWIQCTAREAAAPLSDCHCVHPYAMHLPHASEVAPKLQQYRSAGRMQMCLQHSYRQLPS